jgi:hypothetical protein
MAQHDYNIANQGFSSFRSDLNNALSAVQTTNSGTSRPTGAVAGQIWLDTTSATSPTLKYYDGADDISLATIDHTANTVNWLDSTVSVTGLTTTATGTVLTLSDSSLTSSVNLILQNQKEIRFSETTANGTNYVGFKAPASLSADKIWILPSADGTAGQFLKTDGAGNLSFDSLSFSTPLAVIGNATSGSEIRLPEDTDNGSNYVAIKAPDTISSNLTLTLPSADGTSGQVLQTNGSGVLSFSSPSSDFVLLATTDASSVASVSFDGYFSATYSHYRIMLRNVVPATSGVKLYMRFRESNADVTSSDYRYVTNTMYGDGSNFNEGNVAGVVGDSVFFITGRGGDAIGNSVSQGGMGGEIRLIGDPLDTSAIKQIDAYTKGNAPAGYTQNHRSQGYLNRTPAITGFTLYYSSGNIASGRIQLYGIK